MTSPDSITQIAALRVERTYSAHEAAALLGRSYSWLDQRVRAGQFVCLMAPWCSRYERRGATGASRSRCSETSPQAAIDSTGSRWRS